MADQREEEQFKSLKRLHKVMAVSARIKKFASQAKKGHTRLSSEEKLLERLVSSLMIDSSSNVETLEALFVASGLSSVCFFYKLRDAPGRETGRYNAHQRNQQFMMATCSEPAAEQVTGTCVVAFRQSSAANMDLKNLSDDILVTVVEVPEGKTLVTTIKDTLENVVWPAVAGYKEFGGAKPTHRKDFVDGVEQFLKFLCSTEADMDDRIVFEVPHALFKGLPVGAPSNSRGRQVS